jgi:DNA-binding Xre family transcriptional regulator
MAKIVTKARKLRLDYAAKQGRPVTAKEVADAIGVHYNTMNKIENGKTSAIDFAILAALCKFYGVGVGELLEYDPNGIKTPSFGALPVGG